MWKPQRLTTLWAPVSVTGIALPDASSRFTKCFYTVLREEHRLRGFENNVLRRSSEPQGEETE
jgi:hypothetical protein